MSPVFGRGYGDLRDVVEQPKWQRWGLRRAAIRCHDTGI